MNESEKAISYILLLLILGAVVGALFYWMGYKTAYGKKGNSAVLNQLQPFYATVLDIQDNTLTVRGMEINEINYRRKLTIPVSDETRITWNNTDIPLEGLNVGDNIAVHFAGENLEIHRQV